MSKTTRRTLAAACFSAAAAIAAFKTDLIPEDLFQPWNELSIPERINNESADKFIAKFNDAARYARNANEHPPIIITINSNGGFISPGIRIIEAIEQANVPVILRCDTLAASMAAEILITTENVQRDAAENCQILLHRPYLSIESDTGEKEVHTLDKLLRRREILLSMLAEEEEPIPEARQIAYASLLETNQIRIQILEEESERLAHALAEASHLEPEDFLRFFEDGDRSFFNFNAGVYGLIDTIEGEPIPEYYATHGRKVLCERDTELSICALDTGAADITAAPEF